VRNVPGVALFDWLWLALHNANLQNLAATHQGYGGFVEADWRKIAIALTDTDFGEQKAQSGENACLRQSSFPRYHLIVDWSADYEHCDWTTKHPWDAQGLAGVQASKWKMAQTFNFDLCHVSGSLDRNPASVPSVCAPTHLVKRTDETDGNGDSAPGGDTVRPSVGAD
jgi:hypothetical protein